MVFSKTYKDTENVGEPRRRRQKRSLASEAVGSRLKLFALGPGNMTSFFRLSFVFGIMIGIRIVVVEPSRHIREQRIKRQNWNKSDSSLLDT